MPTRHALLGVVVLVLLLGLGEEHSSLDLKRLRPGRRAVGRPRRVSLASRPVVTAVYITWHRRPFTAQRALSGVWSPGRSVNPPLCGR